MLHILRYSVLSETSDQSHRNSFFFYLEMAVLTSFPPKIDQHMMSVMASMGWDDKAFVPIANESNKKLMVEIKWLQEVRAKKSSLQEMLKERVVWLKQHIDHCHSDVSRNMVGYSFNWFVHTMLKKLLSYYCFRTSSMPIAYNLKRRKICVNWLKTKRKHTEKR